MTKRYGHAPIEMRMRDSVTEMTRVGDFTWGAGKGEGKPVIVIRIPAENHLDDGVITRWTINHENHCGASWSWDGNRERPTLSPSLHAVNIWHGWVRDGRLVEA